MDTSTETTAGADIHAIADEVFATIGTGRQIAPFTSRPGGLTLDDSYRVTALLNKRYEARGDKKLGRKIGFTNRTIWEQYNVYAPIWGYVYDCTVHDLSNMASLPLAGFAEPRIEPEVVFGLGRAPASSMDETALLSCVDWVAHGFEIVQSIFPEWKFSAADTVAANGVHGALLIGPRRKIGLQVAEWGKVLSAFEIDLFCDGRIIEHWYAGNPPVPHHRPLEAQRWRLRHLFSSSFSGHQTINYKQGETNPPQATRDLRRPSPPTATLLPSLRLKQNG